MSTKGEYYLRNKEQIKERNRLYYQANRDARLAYQHEYNWLTEAERKQKNKERYWLVRDKNQKAKPTPTDYPVDYIPQSFSVGFS
jgi:hypothetical protein